MESAIHARVREQQNYHSAALVCVSAKLSQWRRMMVVGIKHVSLNVLIYTHSLYSSCSGLNNGAAFFIFVNSIYDVLNPVLRRTKSFRHEKNNLLRLFLGFPIVHVWSGSDYCGI